MKLIFFLFLFLVNCIEKCVPSGLTMRIKRSPQEPNAIEYIPKAEQEDSRAVVNNILRQPDEFHELQEDDVIFELCTRESMDPVILKSDNLSMVKNKPTKLTVAGWVYDTRSHHSYYHNFTAEYLKKGDYNVILTRAEKVLFYSLDASVSYVAPIGIRMAELIINLNTMAKVSLSNIHIVGYSEGAHIAGIAGKTVRERTGKKIQRISGLDPTAYAFEHAEASQRLDKQDANVVDVYHTSAGQVGINKSIGSGDFWVNGGKAPQPGCPLYPQGHTYVDLILTAGCSHMMSTTYYVDTINGKAVKARKCENMERYSRGDCKYNQVAWFGDKYGNNTKGNFYNRLTCMEPGNCTNSY